MIIDKVFKKPSLLASAKHYRLQLENGKLYVLQMSKARPQSYLSKNSLNGMVANKMLDNYEKKFSEEYARAVVELEQIGLTAYCNKKNCFSINDFVNGLQWNDKNGSIILKSESKSLKLYPTKEQIVIIKQIFK
jgi:hypothetical protein